MPASDPGTPGGGSEGSDTPTGGGPAKCYDGEQVVPCSNGYGVWFSDPGCYAIPQAPQPPASDPSWEGHTPAEGSIYACVLVEGNQVPPTLAFFVATGAAPLPDPRVLAERALEQLKLAVPDLQLAPAPPLATYVGLETWLWIPQTQWADLSLTVTAGNTSVTVVAAPKRVDWDLGEGSKSCYSPGRPWVRGMSSAAKTSCSYTYSTLSDDQPNEKYAVSATLIYDATWTCSGACLLPDGDLGDVPSLQGQAAIEVNERQTVIKRTRP